MNTPESVRSRTERRDRALTLRHRIAITVATASAAAVGVVGSLVAAGTTSTSTVATVTPMASAGDDSVTGDDGVNRPASTPLSTTTVTSGNASKAVTVSGGSTVAKKP